MTIIDHPSPNHSARKPGVRVDTVLLHHTATHGDASARRTLCDPDPRDEKGNRLSRVSAHYLVGLKGDIWRLVPEGLSAWHAGMGRLPWETCPEYDFNHRSIGIEVVNPGDGKTPFTEAQYRSLAWLVPDIVRGWCIESVEVFPDSPNRPLSGMSRILGHRDVAPGRKTDPADNFDWARIREALAPTPRVG